MERLPPQSEAPTEIEGHDLDRSRILGMGTLQLAERERYNEQVARQMAAAYDQLLRIVTDSGVITSDDQEAVRQSTGLSEDRLRRVMGTLSQEGKIQYSGVKYRRRLTSEELASELALA